MRTLLIRTHRPELIADMRKRIDGPCDLLTNRRADLPVGMFSSVYWWPDEPYSVLVHGPYDRNDTFLRERYDRVIYGAYHHPTNGMGNVLSLAWKLMPRKGVQAQMLDGSLVDVPKRAALAHAYKHLAATLLTGLFAPLIVWRMAK